MRKGSNSEPWLFRLALRLYPRAFRERYGVEMWQTARDKAEATRSGDALANARFWLTLYADTLSGALGERWRAMRGTAWTVWLAAGATLLAVAVSVIASFNLYAVEDGAPLTAAAYGAAPLLRYSFDATYIAALVAGVAGIAVILAALTSARAAMSIVAGLAALVALGGFGGLLARHLLNGLALTGGFAALVALCLLASWSVTRAMTPRSGARRASVLGACAGVGVALLVDATALIAHTLALNPVSHALFMQGQISGTHLNALLIGMTAQPLMVAICGLFLAVALRMGRNERTLTGA